VNRYLIVGLRKNNSTQISPIVASTTAKRAY